MAMLVQVHGQHMTTWRTEELDAAPPMPPVRPVLETGQTGAAGLNRRRTFERHSGRIPSEWHTQDFPRVDRAT
jgi:hypothetical protein